jgi:DnaJ-class molecular chaperone
MKCPTCGGCGEVFWDYDDPELECVVEAHDVCPTCNGAGAINDDNKTRFLS